QVGLPLEALCWTRDSKALIVSAQPSSGGPNALILVPVDGGAQRVLTHPPKEFYGDTRPALSDDGRSLAFVRANAGSIHALVVSLSAAMEPQGEPRQLDTEDQSVSRVDWIPGGRELVFAAGLGGGYATSSLRRISVAPGAKMRVLSGIGNGAMFPA